MLLIVLVVAEAALSMLFFRGEGGHPLALIKYSKAAIAKIRTAQSGEVNIWQSDPVYGFSHKPNSSGIHQTSDFRATYTIDANQGRVVETPVQPKAKLLLLGGSYTFGHGVNDDDCFASLVAENFPEVEVVNRGVMGWGTSQSMLALDEALAGSDPPDVVIYSMIPHHVNRNYIRRSWVESISTWSHRHPHFELVDGKITNLGLVSLEKSIPDSTEVRVKELELTSAYLIAMAEACADRQIGFAVSLLPEGKWPPSVIETLVRSEVPMLDLSELAVEGFAYDIHPNPDDHEAIAVALTEFLRATFSRSLGLTNLSNVGGVGVRAVSGHAAISFER